MFSQPLLVILLLLYFALLAGALVFWFALTLRTREKRRTSAPPLADVPAPARTSEVHRSRPPGPSNDEVRGARAKAQPQREPELEDDPFENFIRSKNDF